MNIWLLSLGSVALVSCVSLVGGVFLLTAEHIFEKIKNILIAFAVGALLGDAFLHLIPESIEAIGTRISTVTLVAGFVLFFIIERFFHWQHHHLPTEKRGSLPVGKLNLISDGVHNLIDGVVIGASYMVSPILGLSTTAAVLLHEIPQELGDYAVLVKAGYSKQKALHYNFYSALLSILGVIIVLAVSSSIGESIDSVLGFTAGGFIFIAILMAKDIFKKNTYRQNIAHLAYLIVGVLIMWLLKLVG